MSGLAPLVCLRRPFTPLFTRATKPRTTVPVRVTRRNVAILRSQTSSPAIVQARKTPRTANPGGAGTEESRFKISRRRSADQLRKQHTQL